MGVGRKRRAQIVHIKGRRVYKDAQVVRVIGERKSE